MLGYDFDRQKPIDNYIVDFYCQDLKLVVEIDGITHSWEEVAANDKIRQTKLESFGVTFRRFQDIDVKKKIPIHGFQKMLRELMKGSWRRIIGRSGCK
jgi:very-short-patch-repair endonuclease